jgi:hypothetical protein
VASELLRASTNSVIRAAEGIHQFCHQSYWGNPLVGNFSIRPAEGIHRFCHRSYWGNPSILLYDLLRESFKQTSYVEEKKTVLELNAWILVEGKVVQQVLIARTMVSKMLVVLHPTKEGQFPRDPIFFGQTPVFLEGPWSGDSETVGEIEKGVRIFLREPFSQWKQATRRKSPQWPNVAGIKFVIVVPMCMLVPHEKWVKNLSWQQFSIFGAFSSSHWEKRDFIKTQAMYFVLLW